LTAARVIAADKADDALVLRASRPGRQVVKGLLRQRGATAPVPASVECEVAPERDPLRVLLDAVGLDLRLGAVGLARADRERAVDGTAVSSVIRVLRSAEQLALSQLYHRTEHVLMELHCIVTRDVGTDSKRAIGELEKGKPGRGPQ